MNSFNGKPDPAAVSSLDFRQLELAELQAEYGQHKVLPPGYETQALQALAHYPELRDEHITFTFVQSDFAHTSAVELSSILFPWQQRQYCISMSTALPPPLAKTLFSALPEQAQVGVLGHELAHTADYRRRSNLELFSLGIRYQFGDVKKQIELNTDLQAIQHGLGCQLLAWSETVHEFLSQDGRGEIYLSPAQIIDLMQKQNPEKGSRKTILELSY